MLYLNPPSSYPSFPILSVVISCPISSLSCESLLTNQELPSLQGPGQVGGRGGNAPIPGQPVLSGWNRGYPGPSRAIGTSSYLTEESTSEVDSSVEIGTSSRANSCRASAVPIFCILQSCHLSRASPGLCWQVTSLDSFLPPF